MRPAPNPRAEPYRMVAGPLRSDERDGNNGVFIIPGPCAATLRVIASDGTDWKECELPDEPWDHVSVSLPNRCPNWMEMSFIKDIFFKDDEVVMQLHVAKADHISKHNYCLHLWRPHVSAIPLPPKETVA